MRCALLESVTISAMEESSVALHDLLDRVPLVLKELATEFYRVGTNQRASHRRRLRHFLQRRGEGLDGLIDLLAR